MADKAIKYILPRFQLRLNVLENMNDPKENLRHINIDRLIHLDWNIAKTSSKLEDVRIISKGTRILAFSLDEKKEQGIIRGYEKQRMWTQYADQHTGVCIVIDYMGFIEENKDVLKQYGIRSNKVKYNNNFSLFPDLEPLRGTKSGLHSESMSREDMWKRFQKNDHLVNEYFFKKDIDWIGETEYRFLTFDDDKDDIFLNFRSSLDRVITGLNFSNYYLPSLKSIIKDKDKIGFLEYDDYHSKLKLLNTSK